MEKKEAPQQLDRENLEKLPPERLVEMVLKLQELVLKQNEIIKRLKGYLEKDSKTSSKPPSSDLVKKSEKGKEEVKKARRPGGQKGHEGKTRKGFGRIDRIESIKIEKCLVCGCTDLEKGSLWEQSHVVAQLVEKPIEIVEYKQECGYCADCGSKVLAVLPEKVVIGQDLGAGLQAMLGWMSHYGHLSSVDRKVHMAEFRRIER